MKIFQVSDIHGNLDAAKKIPRRARELEADLIVIAGDITHFGGASHAMMILKEISEARIPILFVSGNCDSRELLTWSPEGIDAVNLHGRVKEFSGYFFAGVGGGSGKFKTLTELEESEFEDVLQKYNVESNKLILVSHSPPYGTKADYTGVKHIGSTAVRRFVEMMKPLLVCTGHAHEGRSITRLGDTVIVNAGPAKNGFCALIELEDSSIDPQLLTL